MHGLTGLLSAAPDRPVVRLLLGASALALGLADPLPAAAQTAPADGEEVLLDVIDVYGAGATTEGSGSYAAGEATLGRGLEATQDLPQTVTVVTQQTIEDQNLTTLDDTMAKTPGIVARTEGYGFPVFYSRGFVIDNYQIDGLPLSYTSGFRPNFDMAIYDRLEVLRGAEALFSGAGEPGGTINLARKRPTAAFAASGALTFGSWDDRRVEADVGGPIALDGRLRGRVIGVAQDREFFYAPADEQKRVAYGILEFDLTPSTVITAGASYQSQDGVTWQQGLPTYSDGAMLGLPRDVALTVDWANRQQTVKEAFASIEHAITPDWTVKVSAVRQDFDFDYLNLNVGGPVDPATGAFGVSTAASEDDGNTAKVLDAHVAGDFAAWGRRHGLVLGATWQESYGSQLRYLVEPTVLPGSLTLDDFPDRGLPRPEIVRLNYGWPEWGSKQNGVYGRINLEASDRLNVILGGRYGNYSYSDTSQSYDDEGNPYDRSTVGYDDDGILIPYLGFTYAITPSWTAYASLSEPTCRRRTCSRVRLMIRRRWSPLPVGTTRSARSVS